MKEKVFEKVFLPQNTVKRSPCPLRLTVHVLQILPVSLLKISWNLAKNVSRNSEYLGSATFTQFKNAVSLRSNESKTHEVRYSETLRVSKMFMSDDILAAALGS